MYRDVGARKLAPQGLTLADEARHGAWIPRAMRLVRSLELLEQEQLHVTWRMIRIESARVAARVPIPWAMGLATALEC